MKENLIKTYNCGELMEKDYLERAKEGQLFIHQFLVREVNILGQLIKVRTNIVKQLLKMLQTELKAVGYDIHPDQLCIQLTGYSLEIWYRKHKEATSAQTIWKYNYKDTKTIVFHNNDPKDILSVIEPFMNILTEKSGKEISSMLDEIERENESMNKTEGKL